MGTTQYEPLHTEPTYEYWLDARRREELLADALRGVELGAHDERVVAWLARTLDVPTVLTVVSWLQRVRAEGMVEVIAVEGELLRRRIEASRGPGNTGPGR